MSTTRPPKSPFVRKPEALRLEVSPVMSHLTAYIEAVVREAILEHGLDEVAAWEYISIHTEHFEHALRRVHRAHFDNRFLPFTETSTSASSKTLEPHLGKKDEAEAERDEEEEEEEEDQDHSAQSSIRQDRPIQGAGTQDFSAKLDNNAPSGPNRIVTLADVQRDLEDLKADFGQRFRETEDAFARLPQFSSDEKLAQGALSLGVSVERLRECLVQMGADRV